MVSNAVATCIRLLLPFVLVVHQSAIAGTDASRASVVSYTIRTNDAERANDRLFGWIALRGGAGPVGKRAGSGLTGSADENRAKKKQRGSGGFLMQVADYGHTRTNSCPRHE